MILRTVQAQPTKSIQLLLQVARNALHVIHHPQQIAAPEFFDFSLAIAAAHEFDSYIQRFAGVVPTDDAAAAVEVR